MAYALPSHIVTWKHGLDMNAGDIEASKVSGVLDEGTQKEAQA